MAKKVLGIPASDIKTGSCRTRYFYMLKNLPEGWTFERYERGAKGDVLYIQKTETPKAWAALNDCKNRGIPVVYERDDFDNPWNKKHTQIMNAVDAVTVISKGLLEHVQKHTKTPCYHVFDGFDYDIQKNERAVIRPRIEKITTYGRPQNIEEAGRWFNFSSYFCDRPIAQMGNSKLILWSLNSFKKKLRKHDLIIIIHAKSHRKKYKDIGRAMVGFAMGIPTISTTSMEAIRIYSKVGYPELVVDNPKQLKACVGLLRDQTVRKKISDAFYDYAWTYWRPELASRAMAAIFDKVILERCK